MLQVERVPLTFLHQTNVKYCEKYNLAKKILPMLSMAIEFDGGLQQFIALPNAIGKFA